MYEITFLNSENPSDDQCCFAALLVIHDSCAVVWIAVMLAEYEQHCRRSVGAENAG